MLEATLALCAPVSVAVTGAPELTRHAYRSVQTQLSCHAVRQRVPGTSRRARSDGSSAERDEDGVECVLGAGGVMPVGLRHVVDASTAARDGNGGGRQAGKVARQMAHMAPATILVTGEVAYVVKSISMTQRSRTSARSISGPACSGQNERQFAVRQQVPAKHETLTNVRRGKPDIHVRLRCRRTDAEGSGRAHSDAGFGAPLNPGMTNRELFAIRCSHRNCCSVIQPIQRLRAASLNAPGCQPTSATQVSPCRAT